MIRKAARQRAHFYAETPGRYVFQVAVTDAAAATVNDTVTVTVRKRTRASVVRKWGYPRNGVTLEQWYPPVGLYTDWPHNGNTGVPVGTVLTPHVGNLATTAANQTFDALDISGTVTVLHEGAIFTRCRINNVVDAGFNFGDTGPTFGPTINNRAWFDQCTIAPPDSQWFDGDGNPTGVGIFTAYGLTGGGFDLTRCNIYGFGDGVKCSRNALIENNYIHDCISYYNAGSPLDPNHADGIQYSASFDTIIQHNHLDPQSWRYRQGADGVPLDPPPYVWTKSIGATSCIIMLPFGGGSPVNTAPTIRHNLLEGSGSYTIYLNGTDAVIEGNRFKRRSWTHGSQYGVISFVSTSAVADSKWPTWTDNVWDDTGDAIAFVPSTSGTAEVRRTTS